MQRKRTPAPPPNQQSGLADAALQALPFPTLVIDAEDRVSYANQALCAALGLAAEQVRGQPFASLLDSGSVAKGAALLAAGRAGSQAAFELNHQPAGGQVAMLSYRASLLPGAEPLLLLSGQQLAGQVRGTERLIALNRRLNALFAVAAAAAQSLQLDDLLRQALEVTGAEFQLQAGAFFLNPAPAPGESGGGGDTAASIREARLAIQRGFSPSFLERLTAQVQARIFPREQAGARDLFTISGELDQLGLLTDDTALLLGPLATIIALPLRDNAEIVGWLLALTDRYRPFSEAELDTLRTIGNVLGPPISNARLHERLVERSGQLQAVLDAIDSGVLLIDRSGTIRYANARLGQLLGAPSERLFGLPRDQALAGLLLPQPGGPGGAASWRTAHRPPRILRRFSNEVHDSDGAPLGQIEVYTDITELEAVNQLKDEFVAAAAHDLKTPVTAIKGYAQIAMRQARRLEDQRIVQQLEVINARSNDLTHLMDSILDVSRIQAGRLRLELKTFAAQEPVARIIRQLDYDLQRQRRAVALDQPAEPIIVTWDQARIERVLLNLLGNAIKYSPGGGALELALRQPAPDEVELIVSDHGIGIPPAERERIFERFYRVRQAIDDGFKGTGMGLYLVRNVVEEHGGRIWAADAIHGGPGTSMIVRLPVRAPHHAD